MLLYQHISYYEIGSIEAISEVLKKKRIAISTYYHSVLLYRSFPMLISRDLYNTDYFNNTIRTCLYFSLSI